MSPYFTKVKSGFYYPFLQFIFVMMMSELAAIDVKKDVREGQ